MQRKNLKYLLPLVVGALVVLGFKWFGPEEEKEAVIKDEHTHTNGLMLDMKELTKCHYDVLIRNKELIEENEKLRKENADLHNKG